MQNFSQLYLGADHGGFEAKQALKTWLTDQGYAVHDCGADVEDPSDDYPQYALAVAEAVAKHPQSAGILFCSSGAGMTIAANKVRGARAVTANRLEEAEHARSNNDANILALSGDWLELADMRDIIVRFLQTPSPTEERHLRRISQIENYPS